MDTLEADAKDVIRARYLVVATLAFQIYDYLTNLDDEIRLVWSDKLTIRQLHFFLNRYLPFATSILSVFFVTSNNDIKECSGGFAALVYISVIGMLIAEFSVFLRADAVWGHKRSVRILLVCTYVCSSGFILFIATRHVLSNTVIPLHISSGCLYLHGDRKIWAALMVYLICDFLALALLLCKAFLDARYANSPMMRALSRDGIAYFSVITLTTSANLALVVSASPSLSDGFIIPESVLVNVLCAHLHLRIRSAHARACCVGEAPGLELRAARTPFLSNGSVIDIARRTSSEVFGLHSNASSLGSGSV
ncbi:hypothetical protein DFH11DRAFT_1795796 [Phellopilus nigrolimitatus]|nr:hypothetical protein DFH11DRAFT_1795796 [Phellopilus nigrolimitatus]